MQGHRENIRAGAPAGMVEDMVRRGVALASGRAGQVDLVEAHKWFNLAAARGDRDAARWREEIAREMSRDQVLEALRAARAWLAVH